MKILAKISNHLLTDYSESISLSNVLSKEVYNAYLWRLQKAHDLKSLERDEMKLQILELIIQVYFDSIRFDASSIYKLLKNLDTLECIQLFSNQFLPESSQEAVWFASMVINTLFNISRGEDMVIKYDYKQNLKYDGLIVNIHKLVEYCNKTFPNEFKNKDFPNRGTKLLCGLL